jgi:hypothetical protein
MSSPTEFVESAVTDPEMLANLVNDGLSDLED